MTRIDPVTSRVMVPQVLTMPELPPVESIKKLDGEEPKPSASSGQTALLYKDTLAPVGTSLESLERSPEKQVSDSRKAPNFLYHDTMAPYKAPYDIQKKTPNTESVLAKSLSTPTDKKASMGFFAGAFDTVKNWFSNLFSSKKEEPKAAEAKSGAEAAAQPDLEITEAERQQIAQTLKEMMECIEQPQADGTKINFENLILEVYKRNIESQNDSVLYNEERMNVERSAKQKLNKQQQEKLAEILKRASSSKWWGQFEKLATTVGLVGTAASLSVPGGAGVAVIIVLLATGTDSFCNDYLKKKLAHKITELTGGDAEREKNILTGVKGIFMLASLAAGGYALFNAPAGIKSSVETASNVLGILSQGGKLLGTTGNVINTHYSTSVQRDMLQLNEQTSLTEIRLSKHFDAMRRNSEAIMRSQRGMGAALRQHMDAFLSIVQN